MNNLIRRGLAALAAVAIVVSVPSSPRAVASVPALDKNITYILPQWVGFASAPAFEVTNQVQQLRSRLGNEGRLVRLGFSLYISIELAPVDPSDVTAIRAQLASTFQQVDHAIAAGEANGIAIGLSFVTALRDRTDALQQQAQLEDRRTMQWHADGSMAAGWATLSRYARKQEAIREAYLRELGRGLAARMLAHPETLVAASGDGEVELSYQKSLYGPGGNNPPLLADYSPFAIAEFRDWLRGTGMYAAGQPFAGEAYRNSARYAADASLATLNADFGQNFESWSLEYEDWSLADSQTADPNAIPATTYNQAGWVPRTLAGAVGFDAPRNLARGNPWWEVWNEFRQMMVWRYNLTFAKWITTSPDPASGATVPPDRWFTDQIVADYLFGNVAPNYDLRLDTSASPHWTADIRPYGSLGITAFSQFNTTTGTLHRTLAAVAPVIAQRGARWGIFEWNPSVPANATLAEYLQEIALVEQYRPSVLVPFYWRSTHAELRIEDTPFETALKELVRRLNVPPLTLSRASLVTAATSTGLYRTPPQLVRVSGVSGETPAWTITSVSSYFDAVPTADGRAFTVEPKPGRENPPGQYSGDIVVTPADPTQYSPVTLTVTLNVSAAGATAPAIGAFDTPSEGATVSGEVGVTGWVIDDIGIVGVDIYRSPIDPEPRNALVFIGSATLVPGARPDVQGQFSTRPMADQAGWGYMLLTNMLPGQGNGNVALHAIARDVDGHSTLLGSRTIAGQNAGSTMPFGTIDTPGQGQTVSGTVINFGWALSANGINPDGSTINVYIDNQFVGHPTYGQRRQDIEGLFPNYPNSAGAVGFFRIDTTQYANGVHTIAWVVTDSAGQARGIGSRYFTIANP